MPIHTHIFYIPYGVRSSIGALLLLTEGVTPLLLNHSRRVGFPTTLCTLSRSRSLSLCRERWCQQINVPGIFLFRCIFLGQCTLKLITLSLQRLRRAGRVPTALNACLSYATMSPRQMRPSVRHHNTPPARRYGTQRSHTQPKRPAQQKTG